MVRSLRSLQPGKSVVSLQLSKHFFSLTTSKNMSQNYLIIISKFCNYLNSFFYVANFWWRLHSRRIWSTSSSIDNRPDETIPRCQFRLDRYPRLKDNQHTQFRIQWSRCRDVLLGWTRPATLQQGKQSSWRVWLVSEKHKWRKHNGLLFICINE